MGDVIGGDKVGGDKVQGDKHEHHHHYPTSQPAPPMPLDQALALLASLPAGPDDPIPPPNAFQTSDVPRLMPLIPNDLFVGRDAALRDVAGRLKAGEGVVITTGMGGVGKTQLPRAALCAVQIGPDQVPSSLAHHHHQARDLPPPIRASAARRAALQ